jgi:uncharacterized protein YbaR (Trm112 family)
MVDPQLLAILVCPETRTPLHEAAEGRLRNRAGQAVEGPIQGGLIREDGRVLFPIVDGIPVMLIDEAIPLEAEPQA